MVSWQAFPSFPSSSRASRVSLAPKTPFPFPFKRLPRRLHKTVMWLRWKSWNLLLQTNEHDNNQDKQEENDQQGNENIDNFKTCEEKK